MHAAGVGPGDRVVYIAPNTRAHLEGYYAVPMLGAVLVPVNYRLNADDFRYVINHSGACLVCAHAEYLAAIDTIRGDVPHVRQFVALEGARDGWLDYEAAIAASGELPVIAPVGERDLLTVNYTSGTTARPKGVMITHRNAWMNVVGTLIHAPMTVGDRYLWTLPMFHANGWTFVWTVTAAGATHVCLRKVDAASVLDHVKRERITMLCAAPTVLIGLANAPAEIRRDVPAGVRVLTAGAPPAAVTIARIEGEYGWTVTHVYGLTETAPFITVCEPRPEHADLQADGRASVKARQGVELVTSGEVRVVDDRADEVPHDGATMGEIVARGNVVMAGYFNDQAATAAAIRDGWFYTGDAAVVHADGYIEIRDRFKDVIISGGENISSVEVESVLLRHPAVLEAAVVGMPDEKWGETPHAFVVLRPGAAASAAEIVSFARDGLAHFKAPRVVHFLDALPKTATGKIQKFVLRAGPSAS
jgi:fatty-acyl-CoA synthase